jgi:hypothetical protein
MPWARRDLGVSGSEPESFLSRRHALFQLFEPVLDYNDLVRLLVFIHGFQHQEAPPIGRHVIVGKGQWGRQPRALEQNLVARRDCHLAKRSLLRNDIRRHDTYSPALAQAACDRLIGCNMYHVSAPSKAGVFQPVQVRPR